MHLLKTIITTVINTYAEFLEVREICQTRNGKKKFQQLLAQQKVSASKPAFIEDRFSIVLGLKKEADYDHNTDRLMREL
eukprot:9358281-Ditylum_brightwellii.AAC.1